MIFKYRLLALFACSCFILIFKGCCLHAWWFAIFMNLMYLSKCWNLLCCMRKMSESFIGFPRHVDSGSAALIFAFPCGFEPQRSI